MTLPTTITDTRPAVLELVHGECLDVLRTLPDGSFDLICADLPFGTTRCKWDAVIDMDARWTEFRRILTPTGTVVANAAGLFAVDMINAARDLFKYSVIWQKSKASNFVHCHNRPMIDHEDVLVFSKGTVQRASRSSRRMTYNPQGMVSAGTKTHRRVKARIMGACNSQKIGTEYESHTGFPRTVQYHASVHMPHHPTQKPDSLLEWIIASYSNPGDLILDPTMGSGTAGAAAARLGRSFVGVERDREYYDFAEARINAAITITITNTPEPATLCLPAPEIIEPVELPATPLLFAVPREPIPAITSKIVHGDCLDVMRTMEDSSADLIVTSPPYNLAGGTKGFGPKSLWKAAKLAKGYDSYSDDLPYPDYVEWQKACLTEMWRLLSPTGAIFYNHKPRVQGGILQTPLELNPGLPVRQIIIWKRPGGMNFSRSFFLPTHEWIVVFAKPDFRLVSGSSGKDVWEIMEERNNDHPAPFPLELPLRAIEATSARRILDPFSGSGTTGVAAKMLDRSYVGIELDPEYCRKSEARIADTAMMVDVSVAA
jgi:DNA modification methylase